MCDWLVWKLLCESADWWRERMYVLFISFKSVVCWILMSADVLLVRIEEFYSLLFGN